jgi:hypothetical protein
MRFDDGTGNICQGLEDIALHVIGCHLIQDMRVELRVDDMAGGVCSV